MKSKKTIMIIGAGVLQVPAILTAKRMGLETAVIDIDPQAQGFAYADRHFLISTMDIKAAVQKAREIKPDGVMTLASDMPMRTVAAISRDLGLNSISEDTAMYATDKGRMRERLQKYDVPIPEFYVARNLEEYLEAVRRLGSRFIVKPADSSASRGVFLVNGECDLREVYEYSRGYSSSGEVLAEEYMSGPEVSVETLTVDRKTSVIAVTDKLTTGAPYFVEMGHSIPSTLPEKTLAAIREAACAAVKAIGIDKGASHTEIIVTNEGPKIVELGARLGGDCITTHLVPLATGVDMVESCIRIALGEKPDLRQKYSKGSAARYFNCTEGRLVSIDGAAEAMKQKGIQEIIFEKKPGDMITALHNSNDRVGLVIAQGETPAEAIEICNKAAGMLKLVTAAEMRTRGSDSLDKCNCRNDKSTCESDKCNCRNDKCTCESNKCNRESFLPYCLPDITQAELDEVAAALKSGWLAKGPRTIEFENRFAEYVGARYAVGMNSCTAALHIALLAAGIGPGDEVITTPMTFVASANTIIHTGATPVFADIDPETGCIDPDNIEEKITIRTRAIVPVHYSGQACDLDRIYEIADRYGLFVSEDAAHAIYTRYKGRLIGSRPKGAVSFSFYATKNLCTGEGGMLVTDDEHIAEKARVLVTHGMSGNAWNRYGKGGSWRYDVEEPGYKYNMFDLQAALGLKQLERLEEMQKRRGHIAEAYNEAFSHNDAAEALQAAQYTTTHSRHLYIIRLKPEKLTIDRNRFIEELHRRNIGVSVHFIPVHLMSAYTKRFGYKEGDFPYAERFFRDIISLPLYSRMTDSDIKDVIAAVNDIIDQYHT